jgi:hypothetical protein
MAAASDAVEDRELSLCRRDSTRHSWREITTDVQKASRTAYHAFIDMLVPFRPELHRYCRRLTGDIWDAEDLVRTRC